MYHSFISIFLFDPVLYIDDRWLYDQEDELPSIVELNLSEQIPMISHIGSDITIVAFRHASLLAKQAAVALKKK